MKLTEKLDIVLSHINSLIDDQFQNTSEISETFRSDIKLIELQKLIDKLVADGYVSLQLAQSNGKEIPNDKYYHISFEGIYFLEKGGYTAQLKRLKRSDCFESVKLFGVFANNALLIVLSIATLFLTYNSNLGANKPIESVRIPHEEQAVEKVTRSIVIDSTLNNKINE